jgi:urate oxidase
MDKDIHAIISYGKARVPIYRVYAQPLKNIPAIPESSFTGKDNNLFAAEIDVEVFGTNFLPAYTQGDNRNVVATDSMKNFILRQAVTFTGATLEDFLIQLGEQFLHTYPQMERLRLTGRELPFVPASVPQDDGSDFTASSVLFSRSNNDYTTATLSFIRSDEHTVITEHRCGRVGLQLFKITGSSFTSFIRDNYTTLPERSDRPLFIYLDVYWRYNDADDLRRHYIPAEQVRDMLQTVFHEFVSESIQHLVHEMGQRLLFRFPQMSEISFDAQNRTRDPMGISEQDERIKVYSDPFSAYGNIKLTLQRQRDDV